jgi:hypothetical protein
MRADPRASKEIPGVHAFAAGRVQVSTERGSPRGTPGTRRVVGYGTGGSAKATMLPPLGRPDLPPPAEMTTNWRPFTM